MRQCIRPVVTLMLVVSVAGCGRQLQTLARFVPGAPPVQRRAPAPGEYKVKVAYEPGGDLKTVGGSRRLLAEGSPLGFAADADGNVVALAGGESFPIKGPRRRTPVYFVWSYKTETSPARAVEAALGTAATGALYLTGMMLLGLLDAMIDGALGGDDESDEREERDGPKERVYYWVGRDDPWSSEGPRR